MTDQPEKMPLTSMDIAAEKRDALQQLFPEVFAEDRIDFDQLKRALGEWVEPGKERFGLTWPGKAECMRIIQSPSVATLNPVREESVNFDETENVFIEGDNLEVLKLLQKAYFGKVKMIYIDPPYNTGKEFIYPDKFAETLDTYLAYTSQIDEDGRKFSTNSDTVGRYHSNWLNMMFPRLYLARNMLREDGVIFISINDVEASALKALCSQIFGEENFVGTIVWKNATDNNPTNIAVEHEYIHVFAKSKEAIASEWKSAVSDVKDKLIEIGERLAEEFKGDFEALQYAYTNWFRDNKPYLWPLDRYKYIDFDGVYTGSQSVHNPGKEGYRYDVIHPETGKPCKEPLMGYRFPEETMKQLLSDGKILFGDDHDKIIELKVYAKDFRDKLPSVIELDGRLGAYDVRQLFPEFKKAFTNPKPVRLLNTLIPFVANDDDIVLDFFAGSSSTAHAVMDMNIRQNSKVRYVMVQLPELPDEKSEVANAGIRSLSELSRERIRRSAKALQSTLPNDLLASTQSTFDLGFRSFSLAVSNFSRWHGEPEQLERQIDLHVQNVDPSASPEDIVYELLLKAGFPLTTKVKREEMAGKTIYSVEDGALLICLDKEITSELIDALAEADPLQVICLDEGFKGNDQLKANAVQTFKARAASRETEIVFRTV